MSNHSALLPAAPLLSGLPDARPASAMGGIDPGALPELVLRSAPAPLEPFANPEGARRVFSDGPETDQKSETAPNWVYFSNFEVFHTLESGATPIDGGATPLDEEPLAPSPAWPRFKTPPAAVAVRVWPGKRTETWNATITP